MANRPDPSNQFHEPMERVSFSYRRITMRLEEMHTEFTHDRGAAA